MKRSIKLAIVAALALGATSAFATNGSVMIGTGAKARGMGGIGIGMGHGAESALTNPAMITTMKSDNEASIGGTLFMPNVKYKSSGSTGGGTDAPNKKSDADKFVIPAVSAASKVNENFYMGVGIWGTSGLGVDYRDEATHLNMVTSLQSMQFGVPLVYANEGFAIGVTPIVQYTSLDINYNNGANVGDGQATDINFGYNVGVKYTIDDVTLGAVYKSKIKADIKNQLVNAVGGMGGTLDGINPYTNTKLSSPAELGAGISYKMGANTFAFDYKRIFWSEADTYKDFKWHDQDVFALGYEYDAGKWAARAGYEYAKSAVRNTNNQLINMFNALGFPGTQEHHITAGGSYLLSDKVSIDGAATYGFQSKKTLTIPDMAGGNPAGAKATVKHSELAFTLQLNYNF